MVWGYIGIKGGVILRVMGWYWGGVNETLLVLKCGIENSFDLNPFLSGFDWYSFKQVAPRNDATDDELKRL